MFLFKPKIYLFTCITYPKFDTSLTFTSTFDSHKLNFHKFHILNMVFPLFFPFLPCRWIFCAIHFCTIRRRWFLGNLCALQPITPDTSSFKLWVAKICIKKKNILFCLRHTTLDITTRAPHSFVESSQHLKQTSRIN